ncbi:hypothetical protein VNO77_35284 [Canavalia gladiata]|uniref:Uncharacterized protein n=1 Tax=Canavalia gladiata TaxID=3824 RepID=A0AAN9KEI4_CANGL
MAVFSFSQCDNYGGYWRAKLAICCIPTFMSSVFPLQSSHKLLAWSHTMLHLDLSWRRDVQKAPIGSSVGSAFMDKNKPILGKSNLGVDSYYYLRSKLLHIYRKQKVYPKFDSMPFEMEHTSPITQLGSTQPLAFVAPVLKFNY